jgi:hypothetical protein
VTAHHAGASAGRRAFGTMGHGATHVLTGGDAFTTDEQVSVLAEAIGWLKARVRASVAPSRSSGVTLI